MSIFTIESNNPKFSFIMGKNPYTQNENNQPFVKKTDNVVAYFVYENDNKATIYSKVNNLDGYTDIDKFVSARAYLRAINLHLSHIFKGDEWDTESCTIQAVLYNHNNVPLSKYFPEIDIKEDIENHISKLTITSSDVKSAIGIFSVITILSIVNDVDIDLNESQYLKYLEIALDNNINYTGIRRIINTIREDKVYKKVNQLCALYNYNIGRGNALESRIKFFVKNTKNSIATSLVDLGCGSGTYFKYACRKYDVIDAVELDENEYQKAINKAKKFDADANITVHNTDALEYINSLPNLTNTDVLLTEVIEHIDYNKSVDILDAILSKSPENVFITVPNKAFNKYYMLNDNETRHDDHLWEPVYSDIVKLVDDLSKFKNYVFKIHTVGDSILNEDYVSSALGITINKV